MFQQFYHDTLGGRFIKSLLAQTYYPMYPAVVDGDHLVEGCYYVYKRFIIKCATSGVLKLATKDKLFPSTKLFPSVFLLPRDGMRVATFYVISIIDEENLQTQSCYRSSVNYYDSETHYHLGNYLRYLKATQGLNLLPFYNVYNATYFTDLELVSADHKIIHTVKTTKQNYKLVGIPILFGHTYTVAIDCPTEVLMRAAFHTKDNLIEDSSLSTTIQSALQNSSKIYTNLKFLNPVSFRIETSDAQAVRMQKHLYLVVQLPKDNISSIVVLEDFDTNRGVHCDENSVRQYDILNPSLLYMNTKTSYAFSDRLIEYLVGNVIHSQETLSRNIATIQTALANKYPEYRKMFIRGNYRKGIWDKDISKLISRLSEVYSQNHILLDQDGNINKDIELVLYLKGD